MDSQGLPGAPRDSQGFPGGSQKWTARDIHGRTAKALKGPYKRFMKTLWESGHDRSHIRPCSLYRSLIIIIALQEIRPKVCFTGT